MNDFAIFYQLPDGPGTFITVPKDHVESEVRRLAAEGAQITAVILLFDFVNFE